MAGLDAKHTEIYSALWNLSLAHTHPCRCSYRSAGARTNDEGYPTSEFFEPRSTGQALRIEIGRYEVPGNSVRPDPAGATPDELVSLAHERGHERSWRARTYVSTSGGDVTPAELAEEHRAWGYAEAILSDLGFTDWGRFEVRRRAALKSYEDKLKP